MNSPETDPSQFIAATQTAHPVLMALLYFDIFSYPLNSEEIYRFSHCPGTDKASIKRCLADLVAQGMVFQFEDYYQIKEQPQWLVDRKINNARAEKYLVKAKQMSRLIAWFPYTRAAFVSGSLSKQVMPEDGDIDYFIITHPGRLWISRTFLILFKKIFLFNSHKYFCVNYFVDEAHLEIEEKNRFTATEVVTLLPMFGPELYRQFLQQNQWVTDYYPNFSRRSTRETINPATNWFKSAVEWCFSGALGDRLDTFFMKKTIQYWNRKFKKIDPEQFAIALKSRRYVSKHHPRSFQDKVLKALRERLVHFERQHDVRFEDVGGGL